MSTNKATLLDVAREAGVSTSTAARVLGGYSKVSPVKQTAVIDAARRLGYSPNEVARSLITGRSSSLGLVVGDIENPFFSSLARSAIGAARERGFNLFVVNTDENLQSEHELVRALIAKRVAGLIVAPASASSRSLFAEPLLAGVPVITVDGEAGMGSGGSIVIDNRSAAYDAVQELSRVGHRDIAFLARSERSETATATVNFVSPSGAARFAGVLAALADLGITRQDHLYLNAGLDVSDATRAATLLLTAPGRPTAIIAASSVIALGVLQSARALQLKLPGDLSLITFDDPGWASVVDPPLTCVVQPVAEIGRRAVEDLAVLIEDPTRTARHRILSTRLIRRGSVSPPDTSARAIEVEGSTGAEQR